MIWDMSTDDFRGGCGKGKNPILTSIYNVFYAAGMLLGPPISSILFDEHGGAAVLLPCSRVPAR